MEIIKRRLKFGTRTENGSLAEVHQSLLETMASNESSLIAKKKTLAYALHERAVHRA